MPPALNPKVKSFIYEQSQFQAAADLYESDIAQGTPTTTYYAVLANLRCHRTLRAKQLAHYVLDRYPDTAEAALCQAVLRSSGDALTPVMQPKTENGGKITPANSSTSKTERTASDKDNVQETDRIHYPRQLYTVEEIAKVGASGVDQTSKPNCWFESSLAALARLPHGQRLIAEMITQVDPQTYVVRFPNDGNEYKISKSELKAEKIHDTALWAGLIDYAESKRYPHNQNMGSEKNWVEVPLSCVCGGKVETQSVKTFSP